MTKDHINGLSFADLGEKNRISKATAYRIVFKELERLPDNNKITFKYCSLFSNIFEFDTKYISVKGYPRKLAFLWGVDYWRHDFPIILLAKTESYKSWATYFSYFRIINHYPQYIVCDDHSGLKIAARLKFPGVQLQTCYFHFSRGVKGELRVATDDTYVAFSKQIDKLLARKRATRDFDKQLWRIYRDWKHDPVALKILADIEKRKREFFSISGFFEMSGYY